MNKGCVPGCVDVLLFVVDAHIQRRLQAVSTHEVRCTIAAP